MLNQRYHVVFEGGIVTVRRPWKKGIELYSSSGNREKGIPAMFGEHEKRQFLEAMGMEFIVVTISINKPEIVREIGENGYVVADPDTNELSTWHYASFYVRDDGVVLILTKERMSEREFFDRVGLNLDMEGKWGNTFKVGKYLKRLYSNHRKYIQGTVVGSTSGSVILVKLPNDKVISVRYADYGKLTDGMNLVSTHCMKMLGLKQNVGQGLQITALSPKGFSKGHAIVVANLKHDLVLFNSKTLLYGDKFIFAMDWLHSGSLYSDVQSSVNFQLYNVVDANDTRIMYNWARTFGESILDAMGDEEKLRKMLQFYKVEFHRNRAGEDAGEFIQKDKDWALLRTLRAGVSHLNHPALMRKIFHLFADKVMDCETNVRIPVPAETGGARYALVDPTIFNELGDPVLRGELKDNTVYCGGHTGDIAFHRQPNGHRGEHHVATAVGSSVLESMDQGNFMFMSQDMIVNALGKLGGGDQDDRLVFYKDLDIVDHFKNLAAYPLVVFPEPKAVPMRVNVFAHRIIRKPVYDFNQLLVMLDQMKRQRVSIGQAVNPLIHDAILTDQRDVILLWMQNNLDMNDVKNKAAFEWLKDRQPNSLNGVASRLEMVIDAIKKEGSDITAIAQEIKEFNQTFMVVAEFNTRGGRFGGRVPESRRNETHPVIVKTEMDTMLEQVHQMRTDLEDIVTELSWAQLAPIPLEILTQPLISDSGAKQVAAAIRSFYHMQWANLNREITPTGDKTEVKARIAAYIKVDEAVFNMFNDHPLVIDAMVELYKQIYSNRQPQAPRDENGKPKPFADGLLWGPRMSGLTMRMLELVGLAGRYAEVTFDVEHKGFAKKTVEVTVDGGLVKDNATGQIIGEVDPMADTELSGNSTTLEKGFIKVAAKHAYANEPRPNLIALTVVNGMKAKGATRSEIMEWQSHEHEQVLLVPYVRINDASQPEHAVRVMLGDREYGHISARDAVYVTKETTGWLIKGQTERTMEVIVEEEKKGKRS